MSVFLTRITFWYCRPGAVYNGTRGCLVIPGGVLTGIPFWY